MNHMIVITKALYLVNKSPEMAKYPSMMAGP